MVNDKGNNLKLCLRKGFYNTEIYYVMQIPINIIYCSFEVVTTY